MACLVVRLVAPLSRASASRLYTIQQKTVNASGIAWLDKG